MAKKYATPKMRKLFFDRYLATWLRKVTKNELQNFLLYCFYEQA